MKKIKLNTDSLSLKKEEISNLTTNEMKHVMGGATTSNYPCIESQPPYCEASHGCTTFPYTTPPSKIMKCEG